MHPPVKTGFPVPPEDRRPPPNAGRTRAHWEAAADRPPEALPPLTRPDGAAVNPPGTPRPVVGGPDVLPG